MNTEIIMGMVKIGKYFAVSLVLSVVLYGTANSLSNAITSFANGIAKNPIIKDDLKSFAMISLVMIEFCALLCVIGAILILVL